MTDTQILDRILGAMKMYAQQQSPISPANAASLVECAEYDRGCKRELPSQAAYQRFWQCRHHPEAIHNWSEDANCEYGCDKSELRWFDHGFNSEPVLYSTTTLSQPPNDHE